MTDKTLKEAASRLMREDAFKAALNAVKDELGKDVLDAKTSEERDLKWNEYSAVERTISKLHSWRLVATEGQK